MDGQEVPCALNDKLPIGRPNGFASAWAKKDAAQVVSFFSDDATYHNIPMDHVQGRAGSNRGDSGGLHDDGWARYGRYPSHRCNGPRGNGRAGDHFVGTEQTIDLPVVGIFEAQEGKITAWRDYFDSAQLTKRDSSREPARRDSNPQPSDP